MNRSQREALKAKTEAIRAEKAMKAEPVLEKSRQMGRPEQLAGTLMGRKIKTVDDPDLKAAQDALAAATFGTPGKEMPKDPRPTLPEPPQKEKKPQRPWTPKANDRALMAKGRLPNGSSFTVAYDAEKMVWNGSLYVKEADLFHGQASGVFQLLHSLDDQYRAHLKAQEGQK